MWWLVVCFVETWTDQARPVFTTMNAVSVGRTACSGTGRLLSGHLRDIKGGGKPDGSLVRTRIVCVIVAIVPKGMSNIVGDRGPSCLLVALNHQTMHNQPRILCLAEILTISKGGVIAVVDRRGSNKIARFLFKLGEPPESPSCSPVTAPTPNPRLQCPDRCPGFSRPHWLSFQRWVLSLALEEVWWPSVASRIKSTLVSLLCMRSLKCVSTCPCKLLLPSPSPNVLSHPRCWFTCVVIQSVGQCLLSVSTHPP